MTFDAERHHRRSIRLAHYDYAAPGAYKERGWPAFQRRLWQRDYYDRVVRSERELHAFRQYIEENPVQWALDPNNPANL